MHRRLSVLVGLVLVVGLLAACNKDRKLKVTGMGPLKGDYLGGQLVRITGNAFQTDESGNSTVRSVKVYFGGVQGTVLRFNNDEELVVQAPGGQVGQKVDVKLYFEPGGVFTYPEKFEYIDEKAATVDDLDTGKKDPKVEKEPKSK
jgi:hypothetical protein